jgi:hypothetical protein
METYPAVRRSTMMGLPCLRHDDRFFASYDRRTHALVIKLDRRCVTSLIDDGIGQPFAPASRVFREWVAIPPTAVRHWPALLNQARAFATGVDAPPARSDSGDFAGFGADGFAFLATTAGSPRASRLISPTWIAPSGKGPNRPEPTPR